MDRGEALRAFRKHGLSASFHYADDSCSEWGLAKEEKRKALEIFDSHPELQPYMRKIAKSFLWSLSSERHG